MAIIEPIELAKTFLTFPSSDKVDIQAAYDLKITNAAVPATVIFEQNFKRYLDVQFIPDSFDSSAIEESGDCVLVTIAASVIRRLKKYDELKVATGSYAGLYEILAINTTDNTIKIKAPFVDEVITFEAREKQIYYTALAWYICAFARWTFQEIKDCKILITATQVGDGSTTSYSYNSITQFKQDMLKNGNRVLRRKNFPVGC